MPGPLESRRRLGKRSIGGLNALQNPSGLPDWSLPVLDLSKWNWVPPTPLTLRQEKLQETDQPAGWPSIPLPRWLAEWVHTGDEATDTTGVGHIEGKAAVLGSRNAVGLLDGFQSIVHSGTLEEVDRACHALCRRLESDRVLFTGPEEQQNEVLDSLYNLSVAINVRFVDSSAGAVSLLAQVYSSLLASGAGISDKLGPDTSHRLLAQIVKIPVSDALCETLELFLRAVAPTTLREMDSILLDVLNKFFLFWSQEMPSHTQIKSLAGALSVLDQSTAKPLLRRAHMALLAQGDTGEIGCHARYAWLSILARTSVFKFTEFTKALSALFGKPTMAADISSRDICELLLDNWTSNRRLQHPRRVRDIYGKLTANDDSLSSGALAYALYTCDKHWEAKIVQIRDCLKMVGYLADFSTSLRHLSQSLAQQDQRLPPRLLRRLMPLCKDHRTALELHDLFAKLTTSFKGRQPRDSSVWEQYLLAAVSDGSTHAAEVCKLLRLCKKNEQTATVAEKLAFSFANSDQLDDRAALRYVTECATFLLRGGDKLPTMALEAIYRVVTRDLTRADWGRTSRLRWLVNTVHRECGSEMADKVAVMLHRWRTNIGTFKAREQRRLEQEERELEFRQQLREEKRVVQDEHSGAI